MAKKYYRLERHVMDYEAGELRALLGGLKKSELIRTIILNEKEFIKVDYDRSLRGFWYSTVKPTLSKLGLLTEKEQEEEVIDTWAQDLSRYCVELIRLGALTSYRDIRVVDESRQRENPEERYRVQDEEVYGYKVNVAPHPNIILATEKDTVYSLIKDLAQLYGCSCISGHGQNAFSAMEDLLRGAGEEGPIIFLTLTDYDPAGYSIAETFYDQATDLAHNLGIKQSIDRLRLGIDLDQLTPEEIEANKYLPKPKGRDEWFNETGGINGEPYGLELDALPPDRIREIFVTGIRTLIYDQAPFKEFIKRAYIRSVILRAIRDKIDTMIEEIIKEEEGEVNQYRFSIHDLALRGFEYIPVEQLCSNSRNQAIVERALGYFK